MKRHLLRALRLAGRLYDRFEWAIWGAFMAASIVQGRTLFAALSGFMLAETLNRRLRERQKPSNELRVGLTPDEAKRIQSELGDLRPDEEISAVILIRGKT